MAKIINHKISIKLSTSTVFISLKNRRTQKHWWSFRFTLFACVLY